MTLDAAIRPLHARARAWYFVAMGRRNERTTGPRDVDADETTAETPATLARELLADDDESTTRMPAALVHNLIAAVDPSQNAAVRVGGAVVAPPPRARPPASVPMPASQRAGDAPVTEDLRRRSDALIEIAAETPPPASGKLVTASAVEDVSEDVVFEDTAPGAGDLGTSEIERFLRERLEQA
jgi:hypothetical protein